MKVVMLSDDTFDGLKAKVNSHIKAMESQGKELHDMKFETLKLSGNQFGFYAVLMFENS